MAATGRTLKQSMSRQKNLVLIIFDPPYEENGLWFD